MKNKINLLAALLGLVFATTAAAQPEQWLQYHTGREGRAFQWIELSTNPPPNVALPKLNARPYFARWVTPMDPAGGRWLCLDRSRKSGPYDRLYFDSNGSRRLDDKSPVNADRNDPYMTYFDSVRFVFKGEDGPVTYHLMLQFYQFQNQTPRLLVSSGGWYEGVVDFAGKKHRVQLIDGNVNGTFNDRSQDSSVSDRIIVDGDSVGERFLGKLLEVDGQFFQIEVARDGAFIKTAKAENLVFGKVRVPENISEVTAIGENGHFVRKPVKGEFALPVGKYRVQGWTINREDDKGAAWTLSGYSFNKAADFEVAVAQPAALEIGEPVRTTMDATESAGQITFSLQFHGPLNESIQMMKGGQQPRGPRLTLASANGVYHYTNNFEFG